MRLPTRAIQHGNFGRLHQFSAIVAARGIHGLVAGHDSVPFAARAFSGAVAGAAPLVKNDADAASSSTMSAGAAFFTEWAGFHSLAHGLEMLALMDKTKLLSVRVSGFSWKNAGFFPRA